MAGGGFAAPANGAVFEAKITPIVIISCIMAATGGLMFGYDVGISGGVTSMDPFLRKFFPVVFRKKNLPDANQIATFFASYTTRRLGRRLTMLIAGVFFITGVVLNAAAQDLAMLIIGRILLGCGVGFANQLNVTIGILFANLVNYGTAKMHGENGWRVSLGIAGVPACLLTLGALLVTDTPNSLIERGRLEEGKSVLRKIRGTDNIEPEFNELVEASRVAQLVKNPFRNLLKRRNRPQLIISIALQVFQQFTGINAIMFYAPVLFNTLGFGAVNVLSTIVSIYSVDKLGRLQAGVQMFLSQVIIAIILGLKVKDHSNHLGHAYAIFVVILVCTFVSAFAWSWGPLGWLIPSETFPLETRSAGQSVTVCTNMLFTFVIGQAFLSMLCKFKFGIFLFFSGWVLVMSLFVVFLLPETNNIPIEEMTEKVWKRHWLWKRFMDNDEDYIGVEVNTIKDAHKKQTNGSAATL
ncbi:hypothetical protein SOVF_147230 [Spinacia oleracea]|nr:hypothetical protein SOVF_147230 [Spinacia oleracea]